LDERRIVVLGAGVTSLSAAWRLAAGLGQRVLLIEKNPYIGGLAATLESLGRRFDLGSHRVHSSFEPEVLALIEDLCGHNLIRRKRNGLILIDGKFIAYPPNAYDIVKGMGFARTAKFAAGLAAARILCTYPMPGASSFQSYLTFKVGKPLYTSFYKPYAEKLWGVAPHHISQDPAVRRTRKGFWTEFTRLLGRHQDRYFLYPPKGIGQVSEALKERLIASGGQIELGADVKSLETDAQHKIVALSYETTDHQRRTVAVDSLIATIPPIELSELLKTQVPAPPLDLSWRALRVVFFVTRDWLPREHETYYIPSPNYLIGRISEIAKYSSALNRQDDCRAFTLEIPCSRGDKLWNMEEAALCDCCVKELAEFKIIKAALTERPQTASLRIDYVYPVHLKGWREKYAALRAYFNGFPNLYRAGRTALFMHCNLDHSMAMGLKVADCLQQADGSRSLWNEIEEQFAEYYVRE
jgi:protoporphyrinogen oxidase